MRATLTFLSPNQIDTCIRDCSIEASKKVGCISPLHLSCICPNGQSNAQFQGAAVGCLLKNGCNLSNALATNSNLCKYGVDCVAPYKNCETSSGETICIDPSIQTCASGSVINLQRRALAVANAGCTPGQEACRVFGGGLFAYECIDTQSNIESCGGCPMDGGQDCTSIFGATSVECKQGKCIVSECEKGLALVSGRCK